MAMPDSLCTCLLYTSAGFVLVPKFGFIAACLASPLAWIMADLFLVPAYFYCVKKMSQVLKKTEPALSDVYKRQEHGFGSEKDEI